MIGPSTQITIQQRGYQTIQRQHNLRYGQSSTVHFVMRPTVDKAANASKQPLVHRSNPTDSTSLRNTQSPPPSPSHQKTWGWISVGLGTAALATGGILYAFSLQANDEINPNASTRKAYDDQVQSTRDLYFGSLTASVIGLVGGSIGIYLLLQDNQQKTATILTLGPGQLVFSGQF